MPSRPFVRAAASRRWVAAALTLALTLALAPGAVALPSSVEVRRDPGQAHERLDEIDERLGLAVEHDNQAQVTLDDIERRLGATRSQLTALRDEHTTLDRSIEGHVRRLCKFGPALERRGIVGFGRV